MKEKNKLYPNTPVLFLIFNREDTTVKVFEEIKKAKPKQIFIASDGPRKEKSGEKDLVEKIRKYVLNNIDWKCEVKTLFRDKNLGCKYAVSGAITWFFKNVDRGIILEDDCLPNQSFFKFCEELLERYKDDERIMQISGTNFGKQTKIKESYFFSTRLSPWGWATWKRAWEKYDLELETYESMRQENKIAMMRDPVFESIPGKRTYKLLKQGKLSTWDFQWYTSCILNYGLGIIPIKNLVTNIGFTSGTHTTNITDSKEVPREEMTFPLVENKIIIDNEIYRNEFAKFFNRGWTKRRILSIKKRMLILLGIKSKHI